MKLRFNGTLGFSLALIAHVLLIGLVFFGLDFGKTIKPKPSEAEPKVMNAVVIDQTKIKAEAKRLEQEEKQQRADQDRRKQAAVDAEKKRKKEEQKIKELKKQQKELKQKKIKEEENLKKKEQQRLLQEKVEEQQQIEKEKKRIAEEKRLEKEAQAEKKRKEQEAIKKAEQEKKRKEDDARKKAKAKAAAEKKRLADEERKRVAAERAVEEAARNKEIAGSFFGKIAAQVERHFNISGFEPGLKCVLEIKMAPGGNVMSVRVIESSGDPRFDRSAEIAAQKASPLPVPDDIKIFNQYLKTVRFRFNPG